MEELPKIIAKHAKLMTIRSKLFHMEEDMLSAALLGYAEALATYNPSLGAAFSTHLFNMMRKHTSTLIRKEVRQSQIKNAVLPLLSANQECLEGSVGERAVLHELLNKLSPPTKTAIEFVINLKVTQKISFPDIKRTLKKHGWKTTQVSEILREIRKAAYGLKGENYGS